MSLRVFVVGMIVEAKDEDSAPGRDDMACWLDGLRARRPDGDGAVILDCTVWDTIGDLVADLTDRRAIKADRVLRAIGKCELQRGGPGSSGGGKS